MLIKKKKKLLFKKNKKIQIKNRPIEERDLYFDILYIGDVFNRSIDRNGRRQPRRELDGEFGHGGGFVERDGGLPDPTRQRERADADERDGRLDQVAHGVQFVGVRVAHRRQDSSRERVGR